MDREEIIKELENVIRPYLEGQGLELVELIYRREGQRHVLRILADRPEGGITLSECTELNVRISAMLDEKDIIREAYTLEVSSPGLDRPLKARGDFLRNLDRRVTLFLCEPVNEKWEFQGVIKGAREDSLEIETDKWGIVEIPLAKISKAKQIIG